MGLNCKKSVSTMKSVMKKLDNELLKRAQEEKDKKEKKEDKNNSKNH